MAVDATVEWVRTNDSTFSGQNIDCSKDRVTKHLYGSIWVEMSSLGRGIWIESPYISRSRQKLICYGKWLQSIKYV